MTAAPDGARRVFAIGCPVVVMVLFISVASRDADVWRTMLVSLPVGAGCSWLMVRVVQADRDRRRPALARLRPGWVLQEGFSTSTQRTLLWSTGLQRDRGVSVTLAPGPSGLELWCGRRTPRRVLALSWPMVADGGRRDGTDSHDGAQGLLGVSVQQTSGDRQVVCVTRRPAGSIRRPGAAQVQAVVDEMVAMRVAASCDAASCDAPPGGGQLG